jgi:hypothetical protein
MDVISTTTDGYEIFITSVQIIQINKRAKIDYQLKTPNNLFIKTLILEGSEYQQWGNNDNYILDLLCAKNHLIRKPFLQLSTRIELYYIKNEDGSLTEMAREVPNPYYNDSMI